MIGRLLEATGREREDLVSVLRHADRMLKLRRERPVPRDRRPAIAKDFDVRFAEIDHWLDRKEHPGLQFSWNVIGLTGLRLRDVVQNIGWEVKTLAKTVTAKVGDHATALGSRKVLYRTANVVGRIARLYGGNTHHQRLMRDVDQPLRLAARRTSRVHPARVAVPAIDNERDIDVEDVAIAQAFRPRDTMADDVVDRDARGMPEALIVKRGRHRAMIHRELENQVVQTSRGDTWLDVRDQHIQCACCELSCGPHLFERSWPVDRDLRFNLRSRFGI